MGAGESDGVAGARDSEAATGELADPLSRFRPENIAEGDAPDPDASGTAALRPRTGLLPLRSSI